MIDQGVSNLRTEFDLRISTEVLGGMIAFFGVSLAACFAAMASLLKNESNRARSSFEWNGMRVRLIAHQHTCIATRQLIQVFSLHIIRATHVQFAIVSQVIFPEY